MRREEQEEKVAALIGGLERVDAPAGFERRVIGRIAESKAGTAYSRPTLLLVLKFAAPAAALMLMGAMFVFFGDREVNITSVPPVQDGQLAPAKVDDVQPANFATASPITPPDQAARVAGVNAPRSANDASTRSGVNSEDLALEGPGQVLTPPALAPRPRNVDPSAVSPGGGVKMGDMLSVIGISAACGGDGCRVTSLSRGSLAERAKLNVGDMIVSIDGRALNASTTLNGPTTFKTFQVVRDGRTLSLPLSSN